jgi:predicted PurR-regulated permease PerM
MTALSIALAITGVVAVAIAAFLVALPLGLLVAGVEAMAAAYVIRYLEARREAARRAS